MPAQPPYIANAAPSLRSAFIVIAAGMCAALHVGKLAPAIPALREALGLSLVQAGFALSLVQLAGVTLGLIFGGVADGLGARRSMVIGLVVLALASALGGAVPGATALMALRALEGLGFLMVVLPAPGLVRQLVPPGKVSQMLGVWGTYMPTATALALLLGPLVINGLGWRAWWWVLAAVTLAMAALLQRAVPGPAVKPVPAAQPARPASAGAPSRQGTAWTARVRQTLTAPGPWLVALCFAMYSGQWLAVVGFLPAIYAQAGLAAAAAAPLTALAAAVNLLGNLAGGRLGQRGVAPTVALAGAFVAMALAAAAAFAGGKDDGLSPTLRYAAVLVFSGVGGVIPATLFALAVRLAPSESTLATTVGWVQQWSSLGQMLGPPAVAWVASRVGGWQYTWVATGACCLAGLALVAGLARLKQPR